MDGDSITAATQRVYNAVARRSPALAFLNYGYTDPAAPVVEMDESAVVAASRRLYEAVLTGFTDATRVLEIGCGRGAGAAFVLDSRPVGEYVGIDLSNENLRLCRERLPAGGRAHFALADARRLPVRDAAFDVAYSIEAAQHFEDRPRCYAEVARALRPGGRFYLAAIWGRDEVESPAVIEASGLTIVQHDDITAHVVRSLDHSSVFRLGIVDALGLPERLRPILMSFVGVRGCENYDGLASGRLVYHRLLLEKST